jgi:hypothetical protein
MLTHLLSIPRSATLYDEAHALTIAMDSRVGMPVTFTHRIYVTQVCRAAKEQKGWPRAKNPITFKMPMTPSARSVCFW